jgi:lysozyme
MSFEIIQGCPVPSEIADEIKVLIHDTGATLNSAYRGESAKGLLHKHGKHTQAELYAGWVRRLPGYLPANPPDRGTHILLGDGVVGKVHQKLAPWQCGMDWSRAHIVAIKKAAAKRGWYVYQPYSDPREYHHLNFARKPKGIKGKMPFFSLRPGAVGPRVRLVQIWLRRLGYLPKNHKSTLFFGDKTKKALKAFQKDFNLKPDGVYGKQTSLQLRASVKHKAQQKKPIKPIDPRFKAEPKDVDKISHRGLEFITEFEGFVNHPYNDPSGYATIGVGHLLHMSPVTSHDKAHWGTITKEEGIVLLRKDVDSFVKTVNSVVKVPLNQNQFDALVSLAFNIGAGAFSKSTIVRLLNKKDYKGAAAAWTADATIFNKSAGKVLPGLTRRRKEERALFEKAPR